MAVLSLFCTMALHAQKVTVSEEVTLRNDLSYDLVGKIDSHFVLFRDRGNKYEARIYDQDLKFKVEQEIVLADKNCALLSSLPTPTSFFIFYGFRHRGKYYIQADQFDQDCSLVSSDTIKLFEDILLNPTVKFAKSEDRSKMIFFTTEHDHEMQTILYDVNTRKTIFDRKIIFKETDLRDDFRSLLVTNEGDMLVIFEKNNFRTKKDKHLFEVHRFFSNNEPNKIFYIPVYRFVSFHSKFIFDNVNQQLVGGGIYTQKNLNRAEGIYYIKHDLMQGVNERVTTFPFETRFDDEITRRSKDKNEFSQLVVSDIALKQDGGALLITEIKKEYERRASYGAGTRSIGGNPYGLRSPMMVDFYYEDMAVFAVDGNGNLDWSEVLHKKQYSHDDDGVFSSFFLFKNPSRLRLVYNDEISSENTVSEYVVQSDGQYQRKSVLSTEYVRLQLRFKDAIQISSNAFVVPSQRSLRLNLVKIEYL